MLIAKIKQKKISFFEFSGISVENKKGKEN